MPTGHVSQINDCGCIEQKINKTKKCLKIPFSSSQIKHFTPLEMMENGGITSFSFFLLFLQAINNQRRYSLLRVSRVVWFPFSFHWLRSRHFTVEDLPKNFGCFRNLLRCHSGRGNLLTYQSSRCRAVTDLIFFFFFHVDASVGNRRGALHSGRQDRSSGTDHVRRRK